MSGEAGAAIGSGGGSAAAVLATCRAALAELYADVQAERSRRRRRTDEEAPMREALIAALSGTRDIIVREQGQRRAEISNLKAFLDSRAQEAARAAPPPGDAAAAHGDDAALREQLGELRARLAELDGQLAEAQAQLAGAADGGAPLCRPEERGIFEAKLVVLQDTRRLLQGEAASVSAELQRRESTSRLRTDSSAATELGLSDLGRLAEQLAANEASLDAAKLDHYFPHTRGFRFKGGGGGVYCAAKDLTLTEISGAFSVELEVAPQQQQEQQQQARLRVTLSGITATSSSQEFRQQQAAHEQQRAAKNVARANSLKRMQPRPPPPPPLRHHSATAASQAAALQPPVAGAAAGGSPPEPGAPPAAAPHPDDAGAGLPRGSAGGNRRNAAVAKFLGQLSQRMDKLAAKAADGDAPGALQGAGGGGGPLGSPPLQRPPSALAGAFASKAAAFGDARSHLPADADAEADLGSPSAVGPAVPAPSDAPGEPEGGHGIAPGGEQQQEQQQPHASPAPQTPFAAQQAPGAAAAAGGSPTFDVSRTGSGSVGSPMHQELGGEGQLRARLGNVRGRLGGLLQDSKQKLQEQKAKLQESRLLHDSKQKLQEGRARLQESKLLHESKALLTDGRVAAKHLLADGTAGIRQKLATMRDGQQHGGPGAQGQHGAGTSGAGEPWSPPPPQQQQRQQQEHQLEQKSGEPLPPEQPAASGAGVVSPFLLDQQQQDQQEQDQQDQQEGQEQQEEQVQQRDLPGPAAAAASWGEASVEPDRGATGAEAAVCAPSGGGPAAPPEPPEAAPAAVPGPSGPPAAGAAPPPAPPAAAAAAAMAPPAAAGSGNVNRLLLDEAAASGLGRPQAGVAGARGAAARRGVVVMLQAEGLEVIGEKGTKVPNIRAAQLGLEVEATLGATFTYSELMGWQSEGLSFEVVELERTVQGANVPLPKALIRSVLNLLLPSVFNRLLLRSLPHELGSFLIRSAAAAAAGAAAAAAGGGRQAAPGALPAGVCLGGEVSVSGPPAGTLGADLTRSPDDLPRGRGDIQGFVTDLRHSQKARAMLGLQEPRHARALALLFSPGPMCLLPQPPGGEPAAAPAAAPAAEGPRVSLRDLCDFAREYSASPCWGQVLELWQTAVDAVCAQLAEQEGLPHGAGRGGGGGGGVVPPLSFDFSGLMRTRVAGLLRKPVRLSCGLQRLTLALDAGAALAAVRDFCERTAREFAANAKGEDALLLLQRPLSQQLELLHLWHDGLAAHLAKFADQFSGASARVLLSADRDQFSAAAEGASYEGPLRVQLPLPLLADLATGAAVWDLALPDPRSATPSIAARIRFVASALAKAAFGTTDDEQEAARAAAAAAAAAAGAAPADIPPTAAAELEELLSSWREQDGQLGGAGGGGGGAGSLLFKRQQSLLARSLSASVAAAAAAPGAGAAAGGCGGSGEGIAGGGTLGRLALSRLALGLVLDERRLRELLSGGIRDAGLVSGVLGCYGQLFSATLAPGWQVAQGPPAADAAPAHAADGDLGAAGAAAAGGGRPSTLLSVATNDVTRVRCELESASFASAVPPRVAVRLLHVAALAVARKFLGSSGRRLERLNQLFGHLATYVGRDCLDLLLCLHVAAVAVEGGQLQLQLRGAAPAAAGASGPQGGGGGAGAVTGGPGRTAGDAPTWPIYFINDVDLLTVLDTVKLVLDFSA